MTHVSVRRSFHLSETGFIKQLLGRPKFTAFFLLLLLLLTQQKRKLRIYISNTYTPSKPEGEESEKVSSWELRVEGKLLEEVSGRRSWGTGPFVSVWTFACCLLDSLLLCSCELQLVLGSDLVARCAFTAFPYPTPQQLTFSHTCTHARSLSVETRN